MIASWFYGFIAGLCMNSVLQFRTVAGRCFFSFAGVCMASANAYIKIHVLFQFVSKARNKWAEIYSQ